MEAWGKFAEHVPGQVIPAGLLVTVPEPDVVTVSGRGGLKVAVTAVAAAIVITQVDVLPLQAPPHPANVYPVAGVSVNMI